MRLSCKPSFGLGGGPLDNLGRAVSLALFGLSVACGEDPPMVTGDVSIGTGSVTGDPGFVGFDAGAELPLVPGSQGGFHVFVNLRFDARAGLGELPLVGRVARRVRDGVLVSRTERRETFVERGGVMETAASLPLFLCPTPIGVAVADEALELEVEVGAADGSSSLQGRATFVPICPEGQQAAFCLSICFG